MWGKKPIVKVIGSEGLTYRRLLAMRAGLKSVGLPPAAKGHAMSATDKAFSGSIATLYESHMVPLLFAPYAVEMAARVAAHAPTAVLEVARGHRVRSRRSCCASSRRETDHHRHRPEPGACWTWRRPSSATGGCACAAAMRWTCRSRTRPSMPWSASSGSCSFPTSSPPIARRGACCARAAPISSACGTARQQPVRDVVTDAMAQAFPQDPPAFFRRTPYGYNDVAAITATLAEAGFGGITLRQGDLPQHRPVRGPCGHGALPGHAAPLGDRAARTRGAGRGH